MLRVRRSTPFFRHIKHHPRSCLLLIVSSSPLCRSGFFSKPEVQKRQLWAPRTLGLQFRAMTMETAARSVLCSFEGADIRASILVAHTRRSSGLTEVSSKASRAAALSCGARGAPQPATGLIGRRGRRRRRNLADCRHAAGSEFCETPLCFGSRLTRSGYVHKSP